MENLTYMRNNLGSEETKMFLALCAAKKIYPVNKNTLNFPYLIIDDFGDDVGQQIFGELNRPKMEGANKFGKNHIRKLYDEMKGREVMRDAVHHALSKM